MRIACILSFLALLTTTTAAADRPFDGGRVWLNGSVNLSYRTGELFDNEDFSVVHLAPSVGVFPIRQILVGLTAEGTLASDNAQPFQYEKWFVGPVVGFYVDPAPGRTIDRGAFYPFIRGFYLLGQADRRGFRSARRMGGEMGMAILVSRTFGVEVLGRYAHDRYSDWQVGEILAPYKSAQAIGWEDATGSTLLIGISFSAYL